LKKEGIPLFFKEGPGRLNFERILSLSSTAEQVSFLARRLKQCFKLVQEREHYLLKSNVELKLN
jgi:hypothetical protein